MAVVLRNLARFGLRGASQQRRDNFRTRVTARAPHANGMRAEGRPREAASSQALARAGLRQKVNTLRFFLFARQTKPPAARLGGGEFICVQKPRRRRRQLRIATGARFLPAPAHNAQFVTASLPDRLGIGTGHHF